MKLTAKEKEKVLKRIESYIGEGTSHCLDKHLRCEENGRYVRGLQWSEGDLLRQAMRERPAVPFNAIFKVVNAIANREIIERFQPQIHGRTDEDRGLAQIMNEAMRWQRDQCETEHNESAAVAAMVSSGYGCMHKYWDPTESGGDGKILDEDVPIWFMLWPARARETNLSDRRWHVCGKFVPKDELEAQFGDLSKEARRFFKNLDTRKALSDTTVPLDGTSSRRFGAMSWGEIRPNLWVNLSEDEVFVAEAEWLEHVVTYKAAIPVRFEEVSAFMSGEIPALMVEGAPGSQPFQLAYEQYVALPPEQQTVIINGLFSETAVETFEDRKSLDDFIGRYEGITNTEFEDFRKVQRDVVKYAIVTDDVVWDYGERPYGFTYEFLTGWRIETREGVDFYGVVDIAKGPQDYRNAMLSTALSLYMTSPKNPLLVEESALPNPEEFLDQIARPGAVAIVPDGFLSGNKFLQLPSPSFPPMIPELLQLAEKAVEEAFGLSAIDMGTQGDLRRISGNVVQAAKTAGNTVVAALFDSIRKYRKRFGLLNARFIQEMYEPQALIRIVGQDKAQDLQMLQNGEWGDFNRFDMVLDEEPVSKTERLEMIDYLTRTGSLDGWLQAGHIDFDSLLDLLPQIPESFKRKLLEKKNSMMQVQQQLQQLQQQLQSMGTEMSMWYQLMETLPQGGALKQQYEAMLAVHRYAAEQEAQQQQMQQQQMQQQQQQQIPGRGAQ